MNAEPESTWRQRLAVPAGSPRARVAAAALAGLLFGTCSWLAGLAGRNGEEIRAASELFFAGTRVVLWDDEGGYDAYARRKMFSEEPVPDGKLRYGTRSLPGGGAKGADPRRPWDLPALREVVHHLVLHFDECGTSRQCFKILQDVRFLSVHFLLDVDGTLYQTLDLQERAWHATIANDTSVGVEIAHPGCWPSRDDARMLAWYERDSLGYRLRWPGWMRETGIRTPGFVARPSRPEPVSGTVHGDVYWQFDFTDEQYEALARLAAALHRVFPRIRLDAPRGADGKVRTTRLSPEELLAFDGILGHFHVQRNKVDPGPAFDWERFLARARRIASQ
ncbi:MAG: hypothetical protein Fur0037_19700 [Planctomycetota bacterium]